MHAYTKLVKKFLNGYMAETREQRGMSKEEMSERLRIEPRSYADLEKERYCLSAPSLMFLESPGVEELIQKFRQTVEQADQNGTV